MGFGDHYLLRGAKYGLTDESVCEEVFFSGQSIHPDLIFVSIDKNLLHADFNHERFPLLYHKI